MENITLSDVDLGLAIETYISVCRDDSLKISNENDYFLVKMYNDVSWIILKSTSVSYEQKEPRLF